MPAARWSSAGGGGGAGVAEIDAEVVSGRLLASALAVPVLCAAAHYTAPHGLRLLRAGRNGRTAPDDDDGGGGAAAATGEWAWEAAVEVLPGPAGTWVLVAPANEGCDGGGHADSQGGLQNSGDRHAESHGGLQNGGDGQGGGSMQDGRRTGWLGGDGGSRAFDARKHVAVVARGGCSFARKAAVAQQQGFAALLVVDPVLSDVEYPALLAASWRPPGHASPNPPSAISAAAATAAVLQTPMVAGPSGDGDATGDVAVVIPVVMALGLPAASVASAASPPPPAGDEPAAPPARAWAWVRLSLAREVPPQLVDVAAALGSLDSEAAAELAEGFAARAGP
jgi:hypothetical protein